MLGCPSDSAGFHSFVPAKEFSEAKPGYSFKNGDKGTGYYLDPLAPTEAPKKKKKKKKKSSKRKRPKGPNTAIYIEGLDPETIDEDELVNIFRKYGIIKTNPTSGEPMAKVYRNDKNFPKGDASVGFLQAASVDLAITMLDDAEYKPGFKLKVTEAKYDEAKSQKKKKTTSHMTQEQIISMRKLVKKREQQALGWSDGPAEDDVTVILANVFDLDTIKNEKKEIAEEIYQGCMELGHVHKVKAMERNPDGIVIVKFASAENAAECVRKMDGRFFGGRQLKAFLWDGVTNYYVKESYEDTQKRIDKFGEFLEQQYDDSEISASTGSTLEPHVDAFVNYVNTLVMTIKDPMLEGKVSAADISKVEKIAEGAKTWANANPTATQKEVKAKQKAIDEQTEPILIEAAGAM